MLGMTLYLTQAASNKNSLLHWCLLPAGSGNMYRHMVMASLTYHLSTVSNLHLVLGNIAPCYLLGLMWVRGLGHQVLGSQVLVNITASKTPNPPKNVIKIRQQLFELSR